MDLKQTRSPRRSEPHLFMSPLYLMLLVFVVYPLLNCLRMAFLDYRLTRPGAHPFVGLANFRNIFSNPVIWLVIRNTVVFVTVTVALQFVLGMTLALALKRPFRFRKLYQGIVFLPWSLSSFIIGLNFRWLFNAEYGPLNDILQKLGIISEKVIFLGSPRLALFTVVAALVWSGIPFFGIMFLAALQSIPNEYYEAATLDGCTGVSAFFHITLPSIKSTVIITLLLRVIWVFNNADMIYVMTKGGPANASHTLASYMFTKAYSTLDFGMASAIGVMFMLVLGIFALVFMRVTKYNEAGSM
jgi:multiple sugar transport system permease protein